MGSIQVQVREDPAHAQSRLVVSLDRRRLASERRVSIGEWKIHKGPQGASSQSFWQGLGVKERTGGTGVLELGAVLFSPVVLEGGSEVYLYCFKFEFFKFDRNLFISQLMIKGWKQIHN